MWYCCAVANPASSAVVVVVVVVDFGGDGGCGLGNLESGGVVLDSGC